ncbi:MAG TPA: methyl-accepting chemotaxis protein [Ktedonobacteraceae bacterium]|jgi:methyl-accepting chemotaxis protein|nr:methyl-accepting chemotaxis protein [Ktedonobacteraceae bacterium]
MVQAFSKFPIYRRLLLAFTIAAIIPDITILIVSSQSIQELSAHGMGANQLSSIYILTGIAILISTACVIALGYVSHITITQPLNRLVSLTQRIGRGETQARAAVSGRDELAIVAVSINNMLDRIVRLLQETQGQHYALQASIERLVDEVSGVGEGDLRIQAEVTQDALGVIADTFNFMVEQLSSLIINVKSLAQEVGKATTVTSQQMAQLVDSAQQQFGHIEQATNETEKMAAASRQVSEYAKNLQALAKRAQGVANQGRWTVEKTTQGMERIDVNVQETSHQVQTLEQYSQEIKEVVNVIARIVMQTNRLALDASIQAAMAGDNGSGFGAVALGIRRLSEQTQAQTTNIEHIVNNVSAGILAVAQSMQETEQETNNGRQLIQDTGTAFKAIYNEIEQQAREINNVTQMSHQQLQSALAVAQVIHTVSEVTQRNSTGTAAVAERMQTVRLLADKLLASVGAFKLRNQQSGALLGPTSLGGQNPTLISGPDYRL